MSEEDILRRLLELEALLRPANYKALYAERDTLTLVLVLGGLVGTEFKYAGKKLTLIDNFADKNVAWTMTPVRRYEIKIEEEK